MLFSAMILSRLTVPLCLNFITMCHLDSHVTSDNVFNEDTAFTAVGIWTVAVMWVLVVSLI